MFLLICESPTFFLGGQINEARYMDGKGFLIGGGGAKIKCSLVPTT
jgi:hypothetical protein